MSPTKANIRQNPTAIKPSLSQPDPLGSAQGICGTVATREGFESVVLVTADQGSILKRGGSRLTNLCAAAIYARVGDPLLTPQSLILDTTKELSKQLVRIIREL